MVDLIFLPFMMLEGFSSLSGNKGLCGVPSLPACPLFWDKGGLNETGKIAIGVSCGVVLIVVLLVIYIVCIRRGPNDYDFDFPQDFTCKYHPPWLLICSFCFTCYALYLLLLVILLIYL